MKKQWMKWLALFLLIGIAMPALAQQPGNQSENRRKRELPSPERNAGRILREFKQIFQLTSEAYDKVYELYLAQEQSLMPEQFGQGGMPQREGMRRPGGPGMGGRPNMGGGMPPQGDFRPDRKGNVPEQMKAQMEARQKEQAKKQEKASKKLAKKMKKILKGEQYTQWQEWEGNRMGKSQRPPQPENRPANHEQPTF